MRDELFSLMEEFFRGGGVAAQNKSGGYFPKPIPFETALQRHLNHEITIGVYPLDENFMVRVMALDIDNHDGSLDEFALMEKVQGVVGFYERLGLERAQFLLENSGKGYHVWLRTSAPVSSEMAVKFLRAVKDEYPGVEIFPASPRPPKMGNLIRLPLGVHRRRYASGEPGAVSYLCQYNGRGIETVEDDSGAVEILKAWRPITTGDFDRVSRETGREDAGEVPRVLPELGLTTAISRGIFTPMPVDKVPPELLEVARNELRACIVKPFTCIVNEGWRYKITKPLTMYVKNVLGFSSERTWAFMRTWKAKNTAQEPPFEWRKFEGRVRCAMKYSKPPTCKHDYILREICTIEGLRDGCEYDRKKKFLPISDQRAYQKLKSSGSWIALLYLALARLNHDIAVNGKFRVTSEELAERSGQKKETLVRKMQTGLYRGKTKLEVFRDAGIINFSAQSGSKFLEIKLLPDADKKATELLTYRGQS